jgi:hypothetical protein
MLASLRRAPLPEVVEAVTVFASERGILVYAVTARHLVSGRRTLMQAIVPLIFLMFVIPKFRIVTPIKKGVKVCRTCA